MKDKLHDEAMAQLYRDDPAYVLQLLNSILEDGDQTELLTALRQIEKAFGGVQTVAEKAHLSPTQLYRTLSPNGNPVLSSLSAVLKPWGYALRFSLCDLRQRMPDSSNTFGRLQRIKANRNFGQFARQTIIV